MSENITGFENEEILPDNYPIYADYLYVCDGKLYRSDYYGINVARLKAAEGFKEVRRCNIAARKAMFNKAKAQEELQAIVEGKR